MSRASRLGWPLTFVAAATFATAWTLPASGWAQAPTSATIFYVSGEGTSEAETAQLSRIISKALRQNPEIRLHDSDKLLAKSAGDVPRDRIKRATESCESGIRQLQAGKAKEAVTALRSSVAELIEVLPFIKKRLLARAMLALGVGLAASGRPKEAQRAFTRVLTWRPKLAYDSKMFDPAHLPLFVAARERVKKLRRGSIELSTEPQGAKAYVNGRYIGVTPTSAWGLVVGEHFVTFKKAGYIKGGQAVDVSPKRQAAYTHKLRRSEKFLLIEQALSATRATLGQRQASAAMVDLSRVLFVDQIIFASITRLGPIAIEAHAWLYDLRSQLLLNEVRQTIHPERTSEVARLAQLLYLNVRYDGALPQPPTPAPPTAPKVTPLYARWWFWTAIGAGLAAGAAAVALPLATREAGCPAGNRCVLLQN